MDEKLTLAPNRPEVLDEVFDGEAVLVNLRTGRYYALDAAATDIWQAVVDGRPLPEADAVAPFVRRLVDEELVVCTGSLPQASAAATPGHDPGMQVFTDMKDILLLDPIHDVDYDGSGWPVHAAPPVA